MGCFLACFGTSKKDRKPRRHRNQVLPRGAHQQRNASFNAVQSAASSVREESENPISLVAELSQKQPEEQPSLSTSSRKKVTFDSNVKTYEHVSTHEDTEDFEQKEKEKEKERDYAKLSLTNSSSEESSITSSLVSYPPNHRYQNCRDSDDEEELDFGDSDLDDEEDEEEEEDDVDGELDYEDEIIEPRRAAFMEEVNSPMTVSSLAENEIQSIGLSRNARDRSGYVHSVLNPVENLSQWKAVKVKGGTPKMINQKENFTLDQEPRFSFSSEPTYKELSLSFKSKNDQSIKSKQDMAVDASLSNWLATPGTTTPVNKTSSFGFSTPTPDRSTSQGSNSVKSQDDRPILGALTVEEIRQFSATNSPRKSPCRSPDEMPIIGTVGTYWSHSGTSKDSGSATSFKGIPNTTSKYSEDRRVNWHTTPFETRLERALNRGAAEA